MLVIIFTGSGGLGSVVESVKSVTVLLLALPLRVAKVLVVGIPQQKQHHKDALHQYCSVKNVIIEPISGRVDRAYTIETLELGGRQEANTVCGRQVAVWLSLFAVSCSRQLGVITVQFHLM